MSDIRIDTYEFNVSGTSGTLNIADVGNILHAFIKPNSSSTRSSGGQTDSTGTLGPDDCGVGLEITATDKITYDKDTANTVKVMFEVWVYIGAPGGAYEFIVRQRGSILLPSGSTQVLEDITGMTDRNDCIPFYTGFSSAQASNSEWDKATLAVRINNLNKINFSRNNTGGNADMRPYYEVVEFTGSAWNVYAAMSDNHDTGNDVNGTVGDVVSLNTDSLGVGGTVITSIDWSTAAIMQVTMEGDTAETGLSDCQMVVRPEGNQVRFTLDNSNSRNDGLSFCYVLQCDDLIVNRRFQYNLSENNGGSTYGVDLAVPTGVNPATPLNQLGLEWMPCTNGEGTAWPRGCLVAKIIANTGNGVRHYVSRSGNNVSASYAFIDVSGLIDSQSTTRLIKHNGVDADAIYFNGVLADKAYLNGNLIFE
jgi:hypothetical protein